MRYFLSDFRHRLCAPLGDAAIGAIGSGVSGLFGMIGSAVASKRALQAQRETNQMNYRINQMNNAFNAQQAQKQMDFSLDMWNKQNEYNTASAQRKRLEDAGLNPYMMMDGGSAGTASSQMSTSAASAASPIPMQANGAISAAQSIGQGIGQVGNAVRNMLEMQRLASEARTAGSDADNRPFYWNDFFLSRGVQRGLWNSQTSLNLASRDMTRRNLDLLNANFDQYVAQQFYQTQQMQHVTSGIILENLLKDKALFYYDDNAKAQLASMSADIALKWSQNRVNDKQVDKLIADTVVSWATEQNIKSRTAIQDIESSILSAVKDYKIQYERYLANYQQLQVDYQRTANGIAAKELRYHDRNRRWNNFVKFGQGFRSIIGNPHVGINTPLGGFSVGL